MHVLAQEVPRRPHGACGLVASSFPSLSCWASSSSGVTLVFLEQPGRLGLPGLVFQTAPTRTGAHQNCLHRRRKSPKRVNISSVYITATVNKKHQAVLGVPSEWRGHRLHKQPQRHLTMTGRVGLCVRQATVSASPHSPL